MIKNWIGNPIVASFKHLLILEVVKRKTLLILEVVERKTKIININKNQLT